MAKRPTIGRNPLDTLVAESHLDAVVPDLVNTPPEIQTFARQEEVAELKGRLEASEAENLAHREEMSKLQTQVLELKKRLDQIEPFWANLKKRLGL